MLCARQARTSHTTACQLYRTPNSHICTHRTLHRCHARNLQVKHRARLHKLQTQRHRPILTLTSQLGQPSLQRLLLTLNPVHDDFRRLNCSHAWHAPAGAVADSRSSTHKTKRAWLGVRADDSTTEIPYPFARVSHSSNLSWSRLPSRTSRSDRHHRSASAVECASVKAQQHRRFLPANVSHGYTVSRLPELFAGPAVQTTTPLNPQSFALGRTAHGSKF
jgi:hypothetical protein